MSHIIVNNCLDTDGDEEGLPSKPDYDEDTQKLIEGTIWFGIIIIFIFVLQYDVGVTLSRYVNHANIFRTFLHFTTKFCNFIICAK